MSGIKLILTSIVLFLIPFVFNHFDHSDSGFYKQVLMILVMWPTSLGLMVVGIYRFFFRPKQMNGQNK
jgi:O-antigen/teichoic acid export membrane protein